MPNGHPDWSEKELPKLEAFFSKISKVLKGFANRYNLMIDKYYHQTDSWTFRFRHPLGGHCHIHVHKCGEEHVELGVSWQICDYDASTMYSKHTKLKRCTLKKTALLALLTEMLKLVLCWRKEDLMPVNGKYNEWKEVSKEEFEKQDDKYPIPKLD